MLLDLTHHPVPGPVAPRPGPPLLSRPCPAHRRSACVCRCSGNRPQPAARPVSRVPRPPCYCARLVHPWSVRPGCRPCRRADRAATAPPQSPRCRPGVPLAERLRAWPGPTRWMRTCVPRLLAAHPVPWTRTTAHTCGAAGVGECRDRMAALLRLLPRPSSAEGARLAAGAAPRVFSSGPGRRSAPSTTAAVDAPVASSAPARFA